MKRHLRICMTTLLVAAAMFFVLSGCSKKEADEKQHQIALEVLEDGGLAANFDNSEKKNGSGSGISIGEGQNLMLETALSKGKVHVTVVSGGTDIEEVPINKADTPPTIDYLAEGTGTIEYMEIRPGDYMFYVDVEEEATGTITARIKELPDDNAAADGTSAAE